MDDVVKMPEGDGMTPVILMQDIWKTYRTGPVEFTALKGVTLEVGHGEFTAIMGPSGSGKSTLMNIIGCLDRKDTGRFILNGTDIAEITGNDLARVRNQEIGFIFQSFNLLPKLNIVENVELPMVYADVRRRERVRRASEALGDVGLMPWIRHRPNEISGGQKQRVAIARAMVLRPSLLLADEPTGNLDSQSSLEIMKIFQQLNKAGTTILLITHEADIAAFARRVVQIVDGAIVADSSGRNAPVPSSPIRRLQPQEGD
jgi:putative ABC transport system ATP-binding protein